MDNDPTNPSLRKVAYLFEMFTKNSCGYYADPLTLEGLGSLMKVLQNKNIITLSMVYNKFNDKALDLILNNLPKTDNTLDVSNNNFTPVGLQKLKEFMGAHPHFTIRAENAIITVDGRWVDFIWDGAAAGQAEPAVVGQHAASAGGAGLAIGGAAKLDSAFAAPAEAPEDTAQVLGATPLPGSEG